ncbi:MAG: PilZ domain-containing protein [Phycisphaerales bacterium]|nr:MAG: PilZ domain-containing protein [Phycisphaerales bacterium]
MTQTQTMTTTPHRFVRALDARQSARILEQAVRTRARVTLRPHAPIEGPELTGLIVAQTPQSFRVTLGDRITAPPRTLTRARCDAYLQVGRDRYVFATNIVALIDADPPVCLDIARPNVLHALERRRQGRARVHSSCPVHLYKAGDGTDNIGALLNASVDGIACRIPTAAADRTAIGDTLRVAFQLAGSTHQFDLQAAVRSKTPAGSERHTIVGLQFEFRGQDDPQRRQLANALTATGRQPGKDSQ